MIFGNFISVTLIEYYKVKLNGPNNSFRDVFYHKFGKKV